MQGSVARDSARQTQETARSRSLQILGTLCGFTAGAWLGAAEAPTKLVTIGISPVVISLIMVIGVFLARRRETRAAPGALGAAGGLLVGRGQYADDLCDSRYWSQHRLSIVEFE